MIRIAAALAAVFLLGSCARQGGGASAREVTDLEQKAAGLEQKAAGLEQKVADLDRRIARFEAIFEQIEQAQMGPPEPDPTATYSVPISPEDPVIGPADAKVTLVEGFEFACGFCNKVRPTVEQLKKQYGDDLRVVYKYFVVHPDVAGPAGLAACAAHQQGKFEQMHDAIWDQGFAERDIGPEKMMALARELGLDMKKFEADMQGQACTRWLQDSQTQLARVGTAGTPSFYINGRHISGAQPLPAFERIIDEELARAKKAIAAGTPADQYYQKHVVEKGLKELAPPDRN